MWETWVRSLGWEDPPEKGKATHSFIFWPGEFHGLYSLGVTGRNSPLSLVMVSLAVKSAGLPGVQPSSAPPSTRPGHAPPGLCLDLPAWKMGVVTLRAPPRDPSEERVSP